jgi:predicted nuclease of predicted toxin-antitoxin system
MKLLFDQNLSFRLCELLSDLFPGSKHVGRIGLGRADDLSIWRHGGEGGFLVVSQDADFAELALLRKPPPKVLWLRCGNRPTPYIADLLRQHSHAIIAFANDDSAVCLEIY